MNENIQALFEMRKIEAPVEKLAREFCRASKMGEFKCAVTTRFGFFCDLCLEDELLHLKICWSTYSRVLLWTRKSRACFDSDCWKKQQGGYAKYGL